MSIYGFDSNFSFSGFVDGEMTDAMASGSASDSFFKLDTPEGVSLAISTSGSGSSVGTFSLLSPQKPSGSFTLPQSPAQSNSLSSFSLSSLPALPSPVSKSEENSEMSGVSRVDSVSKQLFSKNLAADVQPTKKNQSKQKPVKRTSTSHSNRSSKKHLTRESLDLKPKKSSIAKSKELIAKTDKEIKELNSKINDLKNNLNNLTANSLVAVEKLIKRKVDKIKKGPLKFVNLVLTSKEGKDARKLRVESNDKVFERDQLLVKEKSYNIINNFVKDLLSSSSSSSSSSAKISLKMTELTPYFNSKFSENDSDEQQATPLQAENVSQNNSESDSLNMTPTAQNVELTQSSSSSSSSSASAFRLSPPDTLMEQEQKLNGQQTSTTSQFRSDRLNGSSSSSSSSATSSSDEDDTTPVRKKGNNKRTFSEISSRDVIEHHFKEIQQDMRKGLNDLRSSISKNDSIQNKIAQWERLLETYGHTSAAAFENAGAVNDVCVETLQQCAPEKVTSFYQDVKARLEGTKRRKILALSKK